MDRDLDHRIKVMSGQAEVELQEEKLQIAAATARQKAERTELKKVRKQMEAGKCGELLPTIASLTDFERRQYRLGNLVHNLTKPKREKTLEVEISESISDDLGMVPAHGGAWIPFRISASALDRKTDSAGGYLTAAGVSANIIDALRANCAVLKLGALFIGGLKYDFELPVEDSVLSASWVDENPGSDVSQSDPSFALRLLKPHPMQATTALSRQLLTQASPDLEQWLRSRIARAHGLLLDRAAIHGSGLSNEPAGILTNPSIGTVAIGQNGGAATAAHLIQLEKLVSDANAGTDSLAFLTNSAQRAALRVVPEFTTGTTPLWDEGLLDYRAEVSNQVSRTLTKGTSVGTCSAILFANWSSMVVAEFGGALEIVFDPFAQKRRGLIELTSYAAYDCGLAQPKSFAAIVDAI